MVLFSMKTSAGFRCCDPFSFLCVSFPLPLILQKRVIAYPYLQQISGCAWKTPQLKSKRLLKFSYWMLFTYTDIDVNLIRLGRFHAKLILCIYLVDQRMMGGLMGLGFGWWLWGTFSGLFTKRFLCYLMYMSKPSLASAFILKVEALTITQAGGVNSH